MLHYKNITQHTEGLDFTTILLVVKQFFSFVVSCFSFKMKLKCTPPFNYEQLVRYLHEKKTNTSRNVTTRYPIFKYFDSLGKHATFAFEFSNLIIWELKKIMNLLL